MCNKKVPQCIICMFSDYVGEDWDSDEDDYTLENWKCEVNNKILSTFGMLQKNYYDCELWKKAVKEI